MLQYKCSRMRKPCRQTYMNKSQPTTYVPRYYMDCNHLYHRAKWDYNSSCRNIRNNRMRETYVLRPDESGWRRFESNPYATRRAARVQPCMTQSWRQRMQCSPPQARTSRGRGIRSRMPGQGLNPQAEVH